MTATESAPAAAPAPFPMNLRAQASGSDARAERLIRQIRGEVETLRQALDDMSTAQGDMVSVDIDSVIADPVAAAGLPPAVLVRGLIASSEKIAALNAEIAAIGESVQRLQTLNHDLELEHSFNRGRLETLDEVVAALHGNLQDLRYERDQSRLILSAQANANGHFPIGGGMRGQIPASAVEPRANG